MAGPSIKDLVFGLPDPAGMTHRFWIALGLAFILHGSLWLWAEHSERSLESWSAELAARVHAELGHEELVELAAPPPPVPPAPVAARPPPAVRSVRPLPRATPVRSSRPPPPAQSGAIVARAPEAPAPADLTDQTFVTGSADAYAGGVTSATGTNTVAVQARNVDPNGKPGSGAEANLSSAVSLEGEDWSCAWPKEADAEQIDEQTVVLRVRVAADGTAENASVTSDPGHGFGSAAVACALRTRFTAAHDASGKPVRASSPPIRVRFTR